MRTKLSMTDTSKEAVERLAQMNETRMHSRPLSPFMTFTEPEPLGVETAKMLRALLAERDEAQLPDEVARMMLATITAERDAALAKGFWAGRACGGKAAQIREALTKLGLPVKQ